MLRPIALALVIATAPAALEAQAAAASPPAGAAELARLRWIAGCWEQRTATRVTQEHWNAPMGGLMLGTSRTVVRDVAREFEFLRIEPRDAGIAYVAQPGGRPPTVFPAVSVTDTAVTFENLQHDFPQRVIYRRVGADSLIARIEGPQGGTTRGIDFPMRRIACGG